MQNYFPVLLLRVVAIVARFIFVQPLFHIPLRVELLENGLQPHSGAIALFLMRTTSLASSQSCRSIDADAWYKRGLKVPRCSRWNNINLK